MTKTTAQLFAIWSLRVGICLEFGACYLGFSLGAIICDFETIGLQKQPAESQVPSAEGCLGADQYDVLRIAP